MKTEPEILQFLKNRLSAQLRMTPDEILVDVPLDTHYGLSSMDLLALGGWLEDWLGLELDPTVLFETRTLRGMVLAVPQREEA
ncbi:acyl carrier protein [Desulfoluna butyratoxydans]|uniref:Phosphopantetheine attachment site n=1 Tax=Desulfoluna butyratoxydans TaxID=231438 RepID=A0A4U8YPG5_9BACT|nr:acyl carrier protein [Desulfoluna butyratoxydans]VFQ46096.1 phosphopantetheine attachment site [Desulfoluna butyratoxydans]